MGLPVHRHWLYINRNISLYWLSLSFSWANSIWYNDFPQDSDKISPDKNGHSWSPILLPQQSFLNHLKLEGRELGFWIFFRCVSPEKFDDRRSMWLNKRVTKLGLWLTKYGAAFMSSYQSKHDGCWSIDGKKVPLSTRVGSAYKKLHTSFTRASFQPPHSVKYFYIPHSLYKLITKWSPHSFFLSSFQPVSTPVAIWSQRKILNFL